MNAIRFGATLATVALAFAPVAAQNRPVIFGGFGGRPSVGPGIPGWNVPRLFPSVGGSVGGFGGCGFGPIAPVNFTVINSFPPSFYSPPFLVAPPVEPIDLGPPPVDPRVGPQIGGQAAGRFRPVVPQDRDRARQPVAPPKPPPEQPAVESARLVRDGRLAFADGEFGRASELFQRAARVTPALAEPQLLLAQTLIALGKYTEATAAIHRGVRRDPAWTVNGPELLALYGQRRVDFEEHRRRLDDAAAASPDDLALRFVRAYFAWFDGRRDAARIAFAALRPLVADPMTIDLFLNVP